MLEKVKPLTETWQPIGDAEVPNEFPNLISGISDPRYHGTLYKKGDDLLLDAYLEGYNNLSGTSFIPWRHEADCMVEGINQAIKVYLEEVERIKNENNKN